MKPLRGIALAVALGPVAAFAQVPPDQPPPAPGDVVEWHVVQHGDTLEGLTQRYLGDAGLWRENWRLNPGLSDPHRLKPGERIRLIMSRASRSAQIDAVARKVEARPQPDQSWETARLGDRLLEKGGLRTYEKSSAGLRFDDESHLLVTEQSLVFLRAVGERIVGDVTRRSLEIVEGQAQLEARPGVRISSDIEIVVGGAKARPRSSEADGVQTRARKTAGGTAQLMVYAGATDLEAGGRTVDVAAGMGTSVARNGTPAPPEPLLPAAEVTAPLAGYSYDHANPRLAWKPVPGAASYTAEVYRDAACATLVDRVTKLDATRWTPDGLPLGALFFRVSAVSASGLDGFPSPAVPFEVESLWRRPRPPDRK